MKKKNPKHVQNLINQYQNQQPVETVDEEEPTFAWDNASEVI